MAVIYVSTWSGFHTNYPQALHSAAAQSKWAALAALSALSTVTQAIPHMLCRCVRVGGGVLGIQADRINHCKTLMGIKTAITERTSELAAPFALHIEGNNFGRYHRYTAQRKQVLHWGRLEILDSNLNAVN